MTIHYLGGLEYRIIWSLKKRWESITLEVHAGLQRRNAIYRTCLCVSESVRVRE